LNLERSTPFRGPNIFVPVLHEIGIVLYKIKSSRRMNHLITHLVLDLELGEPITENENFMRNIISREDILSRLRINLQNVASEYLTAGR